VRTRRPVALGGLLAIVAALLTLGCGSGNDASGVVIEVTAHEIRFSPALIEVSAGQTVTIKLKNLDMMEHDLEVRGLTTMTRTGGGHGGHGGATASESNVSVHAAGGKSASVTFRTDQKGTYEVFCTQPGHEQLGMVARLVVS
jgi:plastocyanin